jgi:CRISPR-associated endonuclease/helicase Cas3
MTGAPDFSGEAYHWLCAALGLADGSTPFPWQEELLVRLSKGVIDRALDMPTGLGKTSVMAIWLVGRACGANLPRRLVYVVDRRAVVDQATGVALELRRLVDGDSGLKKALGLRDDQSLPISTLRGQYVDNREWLEDPALPAIIVGTVDMVGSRLLFEGYGVSRKMRPYHAGLLGVDTLVVLDEAHLVPPFEHLLGAVETELSLQPREERCRQCVPRFRLLALSATGRPRSANAVGLTEGDLKHEVVKKRLNAKKSLCVKLLNGESKLEDALASQAWALTHSGKTAVRVIVYSDSREVAQQAMESIEKLAKGDKGVGTFAVGKELFVGGRRVFEREQANGRLKGLGFIAGSNVARTQPAFLFATSAGEVGVDLDADHMVCDLVAWERMVQRLGRVNRRGDGYASVVVIVEPKPEPSVRERQAIERRKAAEELDAKQRKCIEEYERKIREWENRRKPLEQLPKNGEDAFDASPGALRDLKHRAAADEALRKILDEATTPEPLRPALTRPLVEAWAMTSLEKHPGRPAVQRWLRGWIDEDPPQTAVVWRVNLPVRAGGVAPRKAEIEAFFEAAPPHTSELVETETFRVIRWIASRAESVCNEQTKQLTAADQGPLREEDVVAFVLDRDGGLRESLALGTLKSADDKTASKKQRDDLSRLLAGAVLIVDARLGGLKDGLLEEQQSESPPTADGSAWLADNVVGFRVRDLHAHETISPDPDWRERVRFEAEVSGEGDAIRWLVVEKWRHDAATEEDRSAARRQLLEDHQSWTEARARRLTKVLALDDDLADVLALAARLHDEGKRAARWQRAFNARADGVYAKTEGPINYRLLDGYRHEFGSLLRVESDERVRTLSEERRDLVLHLIAAHHGFARPSIGTSACEDAPPSILEGKAAEIALRFARLQAAWGPWGLAWCEALLRAADQQASRDNDARPASGGGS